MKIRTDFVTNSSSDNSAEIMIDNLVLLEILQRYKEMGVFGCGAFFAIGTHESYCDFFDPSDFENETKTPAFFVYDIREDGAPPVTGGPKSLDEVLAYIIEVMDFEYYGAENFDQELFQEMKKVLHQREGEIKNAYRKVRWKIYDRPCDEYDVGDEFQWEYYFDLENGERIDVACIEEGEIY